LPPEFPCANQIALLRICSFQKIKEWLLDDANDNDYHLIVDQFYQGPLMSARNLLICLVFAPVITFAADLEQTLVIKDHRFVPAEIKVPAGKKIKLMVDNQDASAEEFESHELNREKVVPANSKMAIFLGPLKPGKYPFFGEFHEKTARGVVIAE
jgi:plastocyanin